MVSWPTRTARPSADAANSAAHCPDQPIARSTPDSIELRMLMNGTTESLEFPAFGDSAIGSSPMTTG